uniref:Uncharacterized protein n=1 Tax=Populus alba TaxID=43335 RepID=A0A4U5QNL3_POPAL|nr:hypothetical protein D5086_0000078320 [Populus alba]
MAVFGANLTMSLSILFGLLLILQSMFTLIILGHSLIILLPLFLSTLGYRWYEVHGSPMFILCKRLKHLKGPKLNKLHFSHISDRVARAEAAMDAHQTLSSNDRGNTQLYAIDKHLQQHLIHLKAAERHDGTFTSFVDEVGAVFVDFYSQLLGTPKATLPLDVTVIQHGPCLDTDSLASLLASVSDMDIKYALFAIDDAKALGPDGFSCFFKKS